MWWVGAAPGVDEFGHCRKLMHEKVHHVVMDEASIPPGKVGAAGGGCCGVVLARSVSTISPIDLFR